MSLRDVEKHLLSLINRFDRLASMKNLVVGFDCRWRLHKKVLVNFQGMLVNLIGILDLILFCLTIICFIT